MDAEAGVIDTRIAGATSSPAGPRRRSSPRLRLVALLIAIAALGAVGVAHSPFRYPWFLFEFRGDLYKAGTAIVDGRNPYRADFIARQAAAARAGGKPQTSFAVPVYPAPALVGAVPVGELPFGLAGTLYFILSVVASLVSLRLLGVRDPRCFLLMGLSIPFLHTLIVGAVEPVLMLGIAVAWRWRSRVWPAGLAVATVVAAKLFTWPLAVWLLITRRWRAFAVAVGAGVLGTLLAWSVIGFAGMIDYPRMLSDLTFVEQDVGVSFVAGLRAVGVTAAAAHAATMLVACALLFAASRPAAAADGGRRQFGLVVMGALVASPIAWPHYYTLVFIPIAMASPAFSLLWLVPMLAWLAPQTQTHGDLLKIVPYLAIDVIVIVSLCRASVLGRHGPAVTGDLAAVDSV